MAAKWAVIGVLVLAVFLTGWVKGNAHGTQKLVDFTQALERNATRIAGVRRDVTEKVILKYLTVTVPKTTVVTETITNEVTRYAEANPDGMCIDARWVSLHNSAASNAIPDGARKADGEVRAP